MWKKINRFNLREFVSANERHPESVRVFLWLRLAAGDSVCADPWDPGSDFSKAEFSIGFLSFNPLQKIIKFQDFNTIFDSLEWSIIKISFEILVPKGPKSAPNHEITASRQQPAHEPFSHYYTIAREGGRLSSLLPSLIIMNRERRKQAKTACFLFALL